MRNRIFLSLASLVASAGLAVAQQAPQGDAGSSRPNTPSAPSASDSSPGKPNSAINTKPDKSGVENKGPAAATQNAPGRTKEDGSTARSDDAGQNKDRRDASDRGKDQNDTRGSTDASRTKADVDKADRADRDSKSGNAKADSADRTPDRTGDRAASGDGKNSIKNVTVEQKTKVRSSFTQNRRQPERNINVAVNIGVKVPRTVQFYDIPKDIVLLVPGYSNYRYFWYEEKVVIVDPNTFEIVDVITI